MVGSFDDLDDLLGFDPLPVRRRRRKRRHKTHCKHGHPMSGPNLGYRKQHDRVVRLCLTCAQQARLRWMAKHTQQQLEGSQNLEELRHPQQPQQNSKGAKPKYKAKLTVIAARIRQLEQALHDVLVYAPEYMHGMPKKHYEKIARGDLT